MQFNLDVRERFTVDYKNAFLWYENQLIGLGIKLEIQVEKAVRFIAEHPKANRIIKENLRQQKVDTFPFLVIYKVYGNKIVIYRLFHNRRNPRRKFSK